eukprot:scaffold1202_cov110-Isochrysis_galbana.AAC.5
MVRRIARLDPALALTLRVDQEGPVARFRRHDATLLRPILDCCFVAKKRPNGEGLRVRDIPRRAVLEQAFPDD